MVVTAVRVPGLQNAAANGHFVAVSQGPIREPGEIAPAELLMMRFALGEDLNVGTHWN